MHFLDTNIVIWLYQGEIEKISKKVINILEANDLNISPIVKLELQYLYEIKRIKEKASKIVDSLYKEIGINVSDIHTSVLIEASLHEHWTREPFDRLIVAHAKVENAFLITKDEYILKHYSKAIW